MGNALALVLHALDPAVDLSFWSRMSVPDVYVVDLQGGPGWTDRRPWNGGGGR